MTSPQLENGHTDIANEIIEALSRIRIPGEAMQILFFILRKTYGWHKKRDSISLSQFVLGTNLKKPTVCKGIRKLKDMNIISTQKDNDLRVYYCFNKHYNAWKPLPKKVTLPKKVMIVTQKDNPSLPKKIIPTIYTKETITKETITKERNNKEKPFRGECKTVIDYLNKVTGKNYRNIENIRARLNGGYTVEDCLKVIDTKSKDKYFIENPKYLNPVTLFRPTNFENYLNETPQDAIFEIGGMAALKRMVESEMKENERIGVLNDA